ncbi:MAG TPA: HEAT repeat domain-containing protein [Thermoanaerobaculia bacterium]|nr:HEAT repeat domain-containing protein [Thermoanaerobaculia bacterium]
MRRFAPFVLLLAVGFPIGSSAATPKEIQKLEKTLASDRDASARSDAAWQLGQLGATESVPALATALEKDSSEAVRANAAASLWNLGEASRPAIPALTKALDDPSGSVVGNAAGALLKLGTPKSRLVPAYRRLLTFTDCADRVIALRVLATEVPPGELFEHAWECAHASEESDDRGDALEALRKIVGRRDKTLAPRILEILKNLGTRDGTTLIRAIGRYDPPLKDAAPVLAGLLTARDEETSSAAASALGDMKAAALPALPDLVKCLETHPQNKTRESAAEAIGEIGPKAISALPALMKAGESDKWPSVRKAAVSAIGEMREAAREAIPMLREQLESTDDWMRVAARNALFRVEPGKSQEVADIADQHRVEEKGVLWEDLSQLSSTLPGRLPEVYELIIYDKYAMATVPQTDSPTGRGKYTYKAGTVTGPDEATEDDCKKKVALAKIDFSVVPKLVQQAPALLGAPAGKVSHVQLGAGVFCRSIGWLVFVSDTGFVEFRLDGKVGRVQKF